MQMAANQQENKFSIVDIRNLHKHFGQNHVLNGVDLQIARGEIVSIIGQSGSGKSTLLRCINGLESYQSGELRVEANWWTAAINGLCSNYAVTSG